MEQQDLYNAYLNVYDEIDEATRMRKELGAEGEASIRNQIAKNTKGGEAADRATKLADKQTFRGNNSARDNLARKQRGDFRKTTSSNPGLHGYAHKATNDNQKELQNARAKQRAVLTPDEKKRLNREEYFIVSYLIDEGYAKSEDAALNILVNMSEAWKESIVESIID